MAVDEQNLFQWIISGLVSVVMAALAFVALSGSQERDKTTSGIDEIKEKYVRRDDLALVLDGVRRGQDDMLKEMGGVRTHVHVLSNAVAAIQGSLRTRDDK